MTAEPSPRRAYLVVVSTRHTPWDLEQRLGMAPDIGTHAVGPDEPSRRLHRDENTWELHEEGASNADVTDLLESLHARAAHLTATLRTLKDEGCAIVLRLSLRFSADDASVPGSPLRGR